MKDLFAIMLDVSRNGVMKVSKIKEFIDYISIMGYNGLELYSEDIYEVKEYPELGYLRGKYSSEELKEIDSYAKEKGIELIPCIQTLAHFTNFRKTKRGSALIDVNDILMVDEETTYEFIEAIIRSCANNFTSRRLNIGMDEAHMLGLGRYLDKNGYQNRTDILLRHLNRVSKIAEKYGFECHMWSDMFIRLVNNGEYYVNDNTKINIDENIKAKIPHNVKLTYWDYYSCDEKHYDRNFDIHKKLCDETYFAGGIHSWYGFSPCNKFALNSMKAAIKSCNKNNIKNIFFTMWGDNGKECSFFNLLPSIFAISEYKKGNYDLDNIKSKFKALFGLDFDDFILLDSASYFKDTDFTKPIDIINRGQVFNDLFVPVLDVAFSKREHINYLEASEKLKLAAKRNNKFKYLFDVQAALCEFEHYKFDLSMKLRKAYQNKDKKELKQLVKTIDICSSKLDIFKETFYKCYLEDNKSYGMEIHNIRFGGLKERLLFCKEYICKYLKGQIKEIDELNEKLIDTEDLHNVVYQYVISPSDITHM